VQVRLEKPSLAVLSTKHYVNLGGSEMGRVSRDAGRHRVGVQVGDVKSPGYSRVAGPSRRDVNIA
jgi:hypothetical protein